MRLVGQTILSNNLRERYGLCSPQSAESDTLYTIGHSNHEFDAFGDLLLKHRIQVLVDVRSQPHCEYTTHFNRGPLEHALQSLDIRYVYMGDVLGGMPDSDRFYDEDGYVLYGKLAESTRFEEGIERLVEGAHMYRVAVMCSEEDPTECHRRLLIGRVLMDEGIDVVHIRGDGSVKTEKEIAEAEEFEKTHGQQSLFEPEEDEWKSTQSVTARSQQSSFSRRSDEQEQRR